MIRLTPRTGLWRGLQRTNLILCLIACLLTGFVTAQSRANAQEVEKSAAAGTEGTILFLAASLQPVLLAIEKQHALALKIVPASSGLLARQIAAGAPADLYITADRKWTTWLEERHVPLLAHKSFLSNKLAFVELVPQASKHKHDESTLSPSQARARLLAAARIAVGDPSHVPVGLYAQQLFAALGLAGDSSFLKKLVPLVNTRATMLHIKRGEATLGIVYRSDALFAKQAANATKRSAQSRTRIAGYLPSSLHEPIAYDLVLLSEKGRALYDFLGASEARDAFRRFGFSTL